MIEKQEFLEKCREVGGNAQDLGKNQRLAVKCESQSGEINMNDRTGNQRATVVDNSSVVRGTIHQIEDVRVGPLNNLILENDRGEEISVIGNRELGDV